MNVQEKLFFNNIFEDYLVNDNSGNNFFLDFKENFYKISNNRYLIWYIQESKSRKNVLIFSKINFTAFTALIVRNETLRMDVVLGEISFGHIFGQSGPHIIFASIQQFLLISALIW